MNRRFTLGQAMLVIAAVALEFGLLPTPVAVVAACLTLVAPILAPTWRWGILGLASIAGLIWLCLPPISSRCIITVQGQCKNNLRQIALAMHGYHRDYGSFPPAYIPDVAGKPMHSWRVLVLPYMEEQALYDAYNFAEPWDGPNNSQLAGMMPRLYACPRGCSGLTSFVAIVGPGTVFPGNRTTSQDDIHDGTDVTILLAESSNAGIPWLEPRDLDVGTMSFRINETSR